MKKQYILSILVLLLCGLGAHAQPYETNPDFKRANHWYFGDSAGMDFSHNPPNVTVGGKTRSEYGTFVESTGIICDKQGELLFYTDGKNVYNKFHSVMLGGNDIDIHHVQTSSSQSNLILKHPDNDSIYYIIITPYAYVHDSGMRFHVVNINRDNGLGEVVSTHNMLHDNSSEKVGAVYHSNGRDIWIVGHEWGNNCFFLYLLTKDGISKCPKYQCKGEPYRNLYTAPTGDMALLGKTMNQGFIKFSPNGKYMSHIYTPNFSNLPSELFSFNDLTGELSLVKNLYWLDYFTGFFMWGNSFSSNSENLFLTEDLNKGLVVYNIALDSFKIISGLNLERGTSFKLGLDDNIYIGKSQDTFVGVISNANDFDSFQIDTQYLNISPATTGYGFPNTFSGYSYNPSINFTVRLNCVVNTIQFHGQDTFSATSHDWLITKQGAIPMTANSKSPLIEFEDSGTYNVRYIAANGSRSDTISKEVVLLPQIPANFLGNDTGWCEQSGASLTIQAPQGMRCYEWSNGNTGNELVADTTGTYFVKIVTPNFCVLYDTINIVIDTVPNAPEIYRDNDTLKTDAIADIYRWFRDNTAVGNNEPRLVIADTGVYKLQIRTFGGCTALSDTIHIPDTANISVNTIIFENIKIYPNPFGSKLIVSNQNDDEADLKIYDVNGKVIYNEKLTSIRTISTDKWAAGIYLIKITLQNGNSGTYKIIKTE